VRPAPLAAPAPSPSAPRRCDTKTKVHHIPILSNSAPGHGNRHTDDNWNRAEDNEATAVDALTTDRPSGTSYPFLHHHRRYRPADIVCRPSITAIEEENKANAVDTPRTDRLTDMLSLLSTFTSESSGCHCRPIDRLIAMEERMARCWLKVVSTKAVGADEAATGCIAIINRAGGGE
jgi:hypothetical protein